MECENSLDDFVIPMQTHSHAQSSKDIKVKEKLDDKRMSDNKKVSDDKEDKKLLPLDKSNSVQFMINEKLYNTALDLLDATSSSLPSSDTMNEVLYTILMEEKDPQISLKSHMCLKTMIRFTPPTSEQKHFYYEVLFSDRQKSSTYDFICEFFDCLAYEGCSSKKDENCDGKCLKNCFCVLDVIMAVLEANHLWTMSQKHKKHTSLICDIFWPLKFTESLSDNVRDLIRRVNTFYGSNNFKEKSRAHGFLIRLLNMMIETAAYMSNPSQSYKVEVITHSRCFGSPTIIDKIIEEIVFTCTDIKRNAEKLNYFLTRVKPAWLETILAESILNELGLCRSSREKLHLRTIIFKCMFKLNDDVRNENKQHSKRRKLLKKMQGKASGPSPKKNIPSVVHHVSELHKASITNNMYQFDTLLKEVDPYDTNFNLKDSKGKTPLHYACEYGYSTCVTTFISQMKKKMKNDQEKFVREIFATDQNGQTPLHLAVEHNHLNVVDILLDNGGLIALFVKDENGKIPLDLAQTSEVYLTLENAETRANLNPVPSLIEKSSPLFCNNSKDHDIYFTCLYHIFCSFSEYFWLESFLEAKPDENTLYDLIAKHFCAKFMFFVRDDIVEEDAIAQFCDDVYILSKLNMILELYLKHFSQHFHNSTTDFIGVTNLRKFAKELFHE